MADLKAINPFFEDKGWKPFPFQKNCWKAFLAGKSGLLHAPTGLGKTLAVWGGPVLEALATGETKGARVLWITPLRALAQDTRKSLEEPLSSVGLKIDIAMRTGDSSAYEKAKLNKKLPFCLITTPESLSLFLTHQNFRSNLEGLTTVIVDEWHEMIGSKRGVQTELALARLRRWFPKLRIWGLSATLGNTEEARDVLLGSAVENSEIISGNRGKKVVIQTILPKTIDRFPWSGHIGTRLIKEVVKRLEIDGSTLLFTNTRSQTEIWFQELVRNRPDWAGELAMHHGSLDREERSLVEDRLRAGTIRCVVCTSSLDLGVDFSPVEQVIQVGSPKGIARLMQRAGRSGHRPGATARLLCVPSNALELVEFAAARDAIAEKSIEAKLPLQKPLDVLVQHLVTLCIGEPSTAQELRREVTSAYSYRNLTEEEWSWALDFIMVGGKALASYPAYQKVIEIDGKLTITDKRLIQMHRMSIGTIASSNTVSICFKGGHKLGTVEETFIARIKQGGTFIFAGRHLQLVRLHNNKATVQVAKRGARGDIPSWAGTKMPLSSELSSAVAHRLRTRALDCPEMKMVAPVLQVQASWSIIPDDSLFLLEQIRFRREDNVFAYTFAGRLVNEGLGSLVGWRISQMQNSAVQVSFNDYGFGLTSDDDLPFEEEEWRELIDHSSLTEDLIQCLNTGELTRKQFRDIAQIAGLVMKGPPQKQKKTRELQVSSNLLFEVFQRYDPDNLLMVQARREILENQLELTRLAQTLKALEHRPLVMNRLERLTPMAFPLWADRLQAHYHGDNATARLAKMLESLEQAAENVPLNS